MDEQNQSRYDPSWERESDADETLGLLVAQQEAIETREDFVRFVEALYDDLRAHPTSWENNALEAYLDALASLTKSLDKRFENEGLMLPEQPSWRVVGDMLLTARIYE